MRKKAKITYQQIRKPLVITTGVLFHLFLVFHLLFSPVIVVMASHRGIVNASLVAFILIFLLSLYFGRAYCSWFCPGCGIQEVLATFIKRKSPNNRALQIKYFIFIPWALAIGIGFIINGIRQIDLTYAMTDITMARKIMMTTGAILIIVPLTLAFGQFASCKYICWQAPIMILGNKIRNYFRWPGLRLRIRNDRCNDCGSCNHHCPMNLDVMAAVQMGNLHYTECLLCGNCIDHCRNNVIRFSFREGGRPVL
jgi:polyferredoxin